MSGIDGCIKGMHVVLTAAFGRTEPMVTIIRFAYPYSMHSHSSILPRTAVALDREEQIVSRKGTKR